PVKDLIRPLILRAIGQLQADGTLPADSPAEFVIERTRSRDHGDFACNAALLLARAARRKPRDVADALCAALPASDAIAKAEVAGPGFMNFFLSPAAYHAELGRVLDLGGAFGRSGVGDARNVQIEFVSANPTGPLHVGHGRAAAIGDCLARLLTTTGWSV